MKEMLLLIQIDWFKLTSKKQVKRAIHFHFNIAFRISQIEDSSRFLKRTYEVLIWNMVCESLSGLSEWVCKLFYSDRNSSERILQIILFAAELLRFLNPYLDQQCIPNGIYHTLKGT